MLRGQSADVRDRLSIQQGHLLRKQQELDEQKVCRQYVTDTISFSVYWDDSYAHL